MTTSTGEPTTEIPWEGPGVWAWHWLPLGRHLRYHYPRVRVHAGQRLVYPGVPAMCHQGLHASESIRDALSYAPGPVVCRVVIGGEILRGNDKLAGTVRQCVALVDATPALRECAYAWADRAVRVHAVRALRDAGLETGALEALAPVTCPETVRAAAHAARSAYSRAYSPARLALDAAADAAAYAASPASELGHAAVGGRACVAASNPYAERATQARELEAAVRLLLPAGTP